MVGGGTGNYVSKYRGLRIEYVGSFVDKSTNQPTLVTFDFFSLSQKLASFGKPTVKLHFLEVSQS